MGCLRPRLVEGHVHMALERFLAHLPEEEAKVWLTLREIEAIEGVPLPASAGRSAYWSRRRTRGYAAWLRQGFVARLDRQAAAVCFSRRACANPSADQTAEPLMPAAEQTPVEGPGAALDRGKYAPLIRLLQSTPGEQAIVRVTIAELEAILGEPLPASALRPGFWSSRGLNASRAWKRLGFVVRLDRECRLVLFIRRPANPAAACPPRGAVGLFAGAPGRKTGG
ncbi:MAG TPA: hypothetical protein VKV26_09995 [Dehalococcoidia bacterium]|nr:hypothetical protein [Dehalococcoidia bacterium]